MGIFCVMLSFRIALRFLLTSRAQSILITVGIAIGIAVTVFIGSLVASLQVFLIDQTLGSSPHLTIADDEDGELIEYTAGLRRELRSQPQIDTILPVRDISAVYRQDSESEGLLIKSGDSVPLDFTYNLTDKVVKGTYRVDGDRILIGKAFANDFDLEVGDEIELTLPNGEESPRTISGIFDLGASDINESLAFTGPTFAADALDYGDDEYNAIEVQVKDVFASKKVAAEIKRSHPGLKVSDWQVDQADLLSALQAQSTSTLIIQVFVVIAIALGIASTLSISALQKTRQIGILKAMGMGDGRSGRIFLWQGVLLGLAGTSGGVLFGLGLIELFQYIATTAPTPLFPVTAQPDFMIAAWIIGLLVAIASALLASRRTTKLDPIEVIQGG